MKILADLTTAAVENPLVTILLGLFICLLGFFAISFALPIQQEPPVKIPVIVVTVPYPGASPWEAQSDVVRELEDKLKGLENVKHIQSTAAENMAVTVVRFTDTTDVDKAKADVRERVDQAKPEFPAEAEEPIVSDVDFEDLPALFVTLTDLREQEGRDKIETIQYLNRLAEEVEDHLLEVPGVNTIDIYGELEKEMRIRIDPRLMEAYGLSFAQVGQAVASQNLAMPGGTIRLEESTMSVRVSGRFDRPRGLDRVVVGASAEGLIHLRDIVAKYETVGRATSFSRLEGRPSVTLVVHKKTGQNVPRLVAGVKDTVRRLQHRETLPEDIRVTYTKDQSYWIMLMLTQLGSSALFGGLLVIVILYFGMGMRSGFMLASAIPFSVLFCAVLQWAWGISINGMTLFSLILILGMVVDGAIVVGENIYRHFEMGKRPRQAALDGVHEVGVAVITADLTTIAAFLPMLFMTGIMGFWMEIMPMIVAFTLVGSILVDHFILPVLCRYFMRVRPTIPPVADSLAPRRRLLRKAGRYLGRQRLVRFLLCLVPGVPLGLGGLHLLEKLLEGGSWSPDLAGNDAYRFLAVFLAAVLCDYLLHLRLNAIYGVRKGDLEKGDLQHLVETGGGFTRAYQGLLRFALTHRLTVCVTAVLALFAALMLPATGRLGTAFFGASDTGWYFIKYELPPGTSIEENYRFVGKLERVLGRTMKPSACTKCDWRGGLFNPPDRCPECGGKVTGELRSTVTTLGEATAYAEYMGGGASGPEFGQIEVELFPKEKRLPVRRRVRRGDTFSESPLIAFFQELLLDPEEMIEVESPRTMFEIMAVQKRWIEGWEEEREGGDAPGRFPGVKIEVDGMNEGPPTGAPINVRIRGRDLSALVEISRSVERICRAQAECHNIESTHYEGRREVRVIPDRDRAAFFGLASGDISQALFAAFQGWEVSRMTLGDEEVDVQVEAGPEHSRTVEDVRHMRIATPRGGTVALGDIARVEVGATASQLKRFDRRQCVTVTADILEGADTAAVKGRVRQTADALPLPAGVSLEYGGEEEEQAESMASLERAFFIGLVLIFFILTAQFNSFRQPFVVITAIPLAIVGSLAGLWLTGNKLDFMAMIGIVCLAGIVVNDAIVLVDFLNKLRRRGVPMLDAAMLAGKARLRPILMTTITTVAGLLPLTLNLTGGGDFWATMGFSIIFGLLLATLLTLVVIPSFYTLVERDHWEPSLRGRLTRPLRLALHRAALRRTLAALRTAGAGPLRREIGDRLAALAGCLPAQAEERARALLPLGVDAFRQEYFTNLLAALEELPEEEIPHRARLARLLAGCPWRVDRRLGESHREVTRRDLAEWVEFGGRRAPLGALGKGEGLRPQPAEAW